MEGESRSDPNPHSPAYSESQGDAETQRIGPENLKNALPPPSITSEYTQSNADKLGFRAGEAFIRPSPIYTHGLVSKYLFDLRNCMFTLSLVGKERPVGDETATEIYLPEFHFPDTQTVVSVSSGEWSIDYTEINSIKVQRLRWWHMEGDQDIKIQGVKRKPGDVSAVSGDDLTYLEQCQTGGCEVM